MPEKVRKTAILIAGTVAVALFAGCSEDRSNLLPGDSARQIDANLQLVQQLFKDGSCLEALSATEEVRSEVEALGNDVDPTLRRNLLDGVTQLQIKLQDTCVESDSEPALEPVVPETPSADTGTTDTEPGRNATGSTGVTGDTGGVTEPETEPAPTPTPPPAPNPTPPDNGSGGVGPSTGGGVSPPTGGP